MRITDVVTPQELKAILDKELSEVRSMGHRRDLHFKYIQDMSARLSKDYIEVLNNGIGDDYVAANLFRLLCLLDKYLEEKYANNSNTNCFESQQRWL